MNGLIRDRKILFCNAIFSETNEFQKEFGLSGSDAEEMLKLLRKSRREWRSRYP